MKVSELLKYLIAIVLILITAMLLGESIQETNASYYEYQLNLIKD